MRPWIVALALFVSLASSALAGGLHARIEGPDSDGFYTARTYSLAENDALEPWALAEGVVDGKGRSVLIRLTPTGERGVYRFPRTWPEEGRWMIRYCLGHPPAPATVVALRADGSVASSKLYYRSDGSHQCWKVLRKLVKPGSEDDC
jgi:hypothetical protein